MCVIVIFRNLHFNHDAGLRQQVRLAALLAPMQQRLVAHANDNERLSSVGQFDGHLFPF